MPTGWRCLVVLNGDAIGRIFTDDPIQPTWGIVQEAYDGTIYPSAVVDTQLLSQLIPQLCANSEVVLGQWYEDTQFDIPALKPEYDGAAIDFTNRPIGAGLENLLRPIPDGYELRQVDAVLFPHCTDYAQSVVAYGSAEKALQKLTGFCLLAGAEVVCEAFAGPAVKGMREMGVATHTAHRRRGLATITCAHLIQACEQIGQQTWWNCAKQNAASVALARKLGYRTEREYRVLAWLNKPEGN